MRAFSIVRAVLRHPTVKVTIAGAALQFGLSGLIQIVTDLRDEVNTLRAELDELRSVKRPGTYPAAEDVDPLNRAEAPEPEAVKLGNDAASWQPDEALSDHEATP